MVESNFINLDQLNTLSQKAIDFAIKGKWQEAVDINLEILIESPQNTETLNRLGKAYMELGLVDTSIKTFEKCLEFSPNNPIAIKNLKRLHGLTPYNQKTANHVPPTPHNFIEDSKTVTTNLINLTSSDNNLKVSPGYKCSFEIINNTLNVLDADNLRIGKLEPRLGSRIIKLIDAGNKYIPTVKSSDSNTITIIIRETYTVSSNKSISSFQNKHITKFPNTNNLDDRADLENEPSPTQIDSWSYDDDDDFGEDNQFMPEIHRIINLDSEKNIPG